MIMRLTHLFRGFVWIESLMRSVLGRCSHLLSDTVLPNRCLKRTVFQRQATRFTDRGRALPGNSLCLDWLAMAERTGLAYIALWFDPAKASYPLHTVLLWWIINALFIFPICLVLFAFRTYLSDKPLKLVYRTVYSLGPRVYSIAHCSIINTNRILVSINLLWFYFGQN